MILVFDFDGTLHQTSAAYGYAVRKVLSELEERQETASPIPPEKLTASDEELARYLGVNAEEMWASFLPELDSSLLPSVIERVGNAMNSGIRSGLSCLFAGIPELLDTLDKQGHSLLILSNCTVGYMQAQREIHHLDQWFSGYYCTEAYQNAPKEEILPQLREDFPGPAVVIGDRSSDIRAALANGCRSIGCRYGYGAEDELSGSDCIVERPQELLAAIMNIYHKKQQMIYL